MTLCQLGDLNDAGLIWSLFRYVFFEYGPGDGGVEMRASMYTNMLQPGLVLWILQLRGFQLRYQAIKLLWFGPVTEVQWNLLACILHCCRGCTSSNEKAKTTRTSVPYFWIFLVYSLRFL